jgi:hypothetical protein
MLQLIELRSKNMNCSGMWCVAEAMKEVGVFWPLLWKGKVFVTKTEAEKPQDGIGTKRMGEWGVIGREKRSSR